MTHTTFNLAATLARADGMAALGRLATARANARTWVDRANRRMADAEGWLALADDHIEAAMATTSARSADAETGAAEKALAVASVPVREAAQLATEAGDMLAGYCTPDVDTLVAVCQARAMAMTARLLLLTAETQRLAYEQKAQ